MFCFEFKLNPKDIRGASLWINQRYPFILVNRQHAESATGRLFTLLHEYGHLLLARGRQGIACDFRGRGTGHFDEPLVNEFAACVLLPARELRAYLSQQGQDQFRENWSDEALKEIAAPFFVSRDVVAITLEEIGLAPPGFYRRKQQQWERRAAKYKPWGRGGKALKKWQRKARELGGSAMRAMLRLHAADRLPVLDAAYVLDTKVERVGEFLGEFKTLVQDAES
ncbi:MAG: hypothetical protein KatS3mg082_2005 [Nitrospiraceae bacterium]|nr:MAG: hypothetical protein KatS3mg082_2005 [Nitrospiraceae bacterium]